MPQVSSNTLQQAIAFHSGGNFGEADRLYQAVLLETPQDPGALHYLGVLRHQQGRDAEAIGLIDLALAAGGTGAEIYSNRGLILERLGQFEQALESCSRAIELKPDYPQAYNNRGNVLQALARFTEALADYDKSIEQKPDYAEAFNNRGNTLQKLGRLHEAVASYDKALELRADYPEALNNRGKAYQAMGRHDEAYKSFNQAVEKRAAYAEACNNRGNALQEMRRFEEALRSYDLAIEAAPQFTEAWNNRGNALQELRRYQEALECYDKAIALRPEYPEAFSNRGNALQRLKRPEDALLSYEKAIELKPNYPEAFNNRANLLKDMKRHDEALRNYDKAVELRPDYPEAFCNRANLLMEVKRHADALKSLDQAIAIRPSHPDAYNNKGNCLQELKRHDEALKCYEKALELRPDFPDAWNNRGNALQAQNKCVEALAAYDRAIELKPDFAEAHNNRAITLKEMRRFDACIAAYNRAIELKPSYAEAYSNLGNALKEVGRLEDALKSYDKARELKPEYIEAYWNKGLLLLSMGDWAEGWDAYETRWKRKNDEGKKPRVSGVEWNGEPLEGKTLLIYGEQGNGDKIQFIRYIPLLQSQGAKVTLAVDERIAELMRRALPGVTVVNRISPREKFDFNIALMSLAQRFRTRTDDVPAPIPYISADGKRLEKWKARLGPTGFKIGIAWQGNAAGAVDNGRSIPLREFAPLARIPGVRLISLQKNFGTEQVANLPPDMKVETLGDDFDAGSDGFIDSAAVMQLMDLIVSSDTALAHLAGAVGAPTYLALKHVPDWRWLLERDDTPWYPTMRLFRQPDVDNWTSVFDRMSREVAGLVRKKLAGQGIILPEAAAPAVRLSWGELIDRMTILELKLERLTSESSAEQVRYELSGLQGHYTELAASDSRLPELKDKLASVNRALWDIEERIRAKEASHAFDDEFITLARAVFLRSDWRSRLKREIDDVLLTGMSDVKEYPDYIGAGPALVVDG